MIGTPACDFSNHRTHCMVWFWSCGLVFSLMFWTCWLFWCPWSVFTQDYAAADPKQRKSQGDKQSKSGCLNWWYWFRTKWQYEINKDEAVNMRVVMLQSRPKDLIKAEVTRWLWGTSRPDCLRMQTNSEESWKSPAELWTIYIFAPTWSQLTLV